eukprot:1909434-Rhodomonas_salina.2
MPEYTPVAKSEHRSPHLCTSTDAYTPSCTVRPPSVFPYTLRADTPTTPNEFPSGRSLQSCGTLSGGLHAVLLSASALGHTMKSSLAPHKVCPLISTIRNSNRYPPPAKSRTSSPVNVALPPTTVTFSAPSSCRFHPPSLRSVYPSNTEHATPSTSVVQSRSALLLARRTETDTRCAAPTPDISLPCWSISTAAMSGSGAPATLSPGFCGSIRRR